MLKRAHMALLLLPFSFFACTELSVDRGPSGGTSDAADAIGGLDVSLKYDTASTEDVGTETFLGVDGAQGADTHDAALDSHSGDAIVLTDADGGPSVGSCVLGTSSLPCILK